MKKDKRIIRRANLNDLDLISKLEKIWSNERVSWGVLPSKKNELKKEIKKDVFFLAEDNQKIIGYISGEIKKYKRNIKMWYKNR